MVISNDPRKDSNMHSMNSGKQLRGHKLLLMDVQLELPQPLAGGSILRQKLTAQILERLVGQQLLRRLDVADMQRRAVEEVQVEQRDAVAVQANVVGRLTLPDRHAGPRRRELPLEHAPRERPVGAVVKDARGEEVEVDCLIARLHALKLGDEVGFARQPVVVRSLPSEPLHPVAQAA